MRSIPLPEMTALQFLVVGLLFAGPQSGTRLRRRIESSGVKIGPPSFSRLMVRMEEKGYLYAACESTPAGMRYVRPRRFEATDLGVAVWRRVREFYAIAAPPPPELMPIVTEEGQLARFPPKIRRAILRRRVRRKLKRTFGKYLGGDE